MSETILCCFKYLEFGKYMQIFLYEKATDSKQKKEQQLQNSEFQNFFLHVERKVITWSPFSKS